jgi:uncharacterized protein
MVQEVVGYLLGIYFRSPVGIYVNVFTPTEIRWNRNSALVKLVQTTGFPLDESVEIRVEVPAPTEFTIFVPIPGWLESSPQVKVNGKSFDGASEPQTFAAIRRRWKQHDTIHVAFQLRPRLTPVDAEHQDTVAVMHGPAGAGGVESPTDIFTRPLPLGRGFKLAHRHRDYL